MHSALRCAVWALRRPAGSAPSACSLWQASGGCAWRALSAAALPAASARPGHDAASLSHADAQSGGLSTLTAPWKSSAIAQRERPSPAVTEQLPWHSWGAQQQSGAQIRSFATRPHSVAGRRVAAAQQRARSRPPPPHDAASVTAASAAGSSPPDAAQAQPPQQSSASGGDVAATSTDAVQPMPATLHEV